MRLHVSEERRITLDLQPDDSQTDDTNPPFPGMRLFLRQFIAAATFLETNRSAGHRSDNRGFAGSGKSILAARVRGNISPPVKTSMFTLAQPGAPAKAVAPSRDFTEDPC
jgi:hypothetical protein